jgi:hypothetical protein
MTWATFAANVALLIYNLVMLRFIRRLLRTASHYEQRARWMMTRTHEDRG